MKTTLTPEQSATLIAKGISADKASEIKEYDDEVSQWTHRGVPIFTLADICELLPKELMIDGVTYYLNMLCMETWVANYINAVGDNYVTGILRSTTELIDALYSLLCWVIDKGYIDLTK